MSSKYEISTELLLLVAVCKQWVYQGEGQLQVHVLIENFQIH